MCGLRIRKAAFIDGNGAISVEEEPVPELGSGEVLVEVYASLVSSGTEMRGVKGRRQSPNPSAPKRLFGYQNAGIVIAKSDDCDRFDIGDRLACMGVDDPERPGRGALHATYAIVPKNLCVPIPDNVTYEEAAFNHLAATALQAIRRCQLEFGENMVVVGLGVVGQICCQLARLCGTHVMGVDPLPLRVKTAKELGADAVAEAGKDDVVAVAKEFTRGYGMDCAIIAFGDEGTAAFKQIVQMMKVSPDGHKMGRIVNVGGASITHSFAASLGNLDVRSAARTGPGFLDRDYERGSDYPPVFVQWTTRRNLEEIMRSMSEGKLKVKPLISHEYPLDQAPEACEKIIQTPSETLGVILKAR